MTLRSNSGSCAPACGSKEKIFFSIVLTQAEACSARLKSCPDTFLFAGKTIFQQPCNLALSFGSACGLHVDLLAVFQRVGGVYDDLIICVQAAKNLYLCPKVTANDYRF